MLVVVCFFDQLLQAETQLGLNGTSQLAGQRENLWFIKPIDAWVTVLKFDILQWN